MVEPIDPEQRIAELEAEQQRTLEENAKAHAQLMAEVDAEYEAYRQTQQDADRGMAEAARQLSEITDQAQRDADAFTASVQQQYGYEGELRGDKDQVRQAIYDAVEKLLAVFNPQRDLIALNAQVVANRDQGTTMIDRVTISLQRPKTQVSTGGRGKES